MKINTRNLQQLTGVLMILGVLWAYGCATGSAPVETIANVEMTIKQARESNAITYAPLALKFAEDKLSKAKKAVENAEYEQAQFLAEKALADAQYAEATSRAEKAKKLVEELRVSINTLRNEIDRAQQAN